ncbi:MAG: GNAT family N-acetyltransferase [Acidobacteriota bacterium]
MTIRPATGKDLTAWSRMRAAVYSDLDPALDQAEMDRVLASDDFTCFIAEAPDGAAAGFAEVSLRNIVDGVAGGPVGYLEGLYVEAAHRGTGTGRALIDRAIAWCREHGCSHLATDAELENTAAQNLYEHLGFERKWTVVQFLKEIASKEDS